MKVLGDLLLGPGAAVDPVVAHDVEGVGQSEDSGRQRDILPGQTVGVAAPVPALVVVPDTRDDRSEAAHRLDDLGPLGGVLHHQLALRAVESARLVEDGVRDPDLADVVQETGNENLVDVFLGKLHLRRQFLGDAGHVGGVVVGVGIAGVQRLGQGQYQVERDSRVALEELRVPDRGGRLGADGGQEVGVGFPEAALLVPVGGAGHPQDAVLDLEGGRYQVFEPQALQGRLVFGNRRNDRALGFTALVGLGDDPPRFERKKQALLDFPPLVLEGLDLEESLVFLHRLEQGAEVGPQEGRDLLDHRGEHFVQFGIGDDGGGDPVEPGQFVLQLIGQFPLQGPFLGAFPEYRVDRLRDGLEEPEQLMGSHDMALQLFPHAPVKQGEGREELIDGEAFPQIGHDVVEGGHLGGDPGVRGMALGQYGGEEALDDRPALDRFQRQVGRLPTPTLSDPVADVEDQLFESRRIGGGRIREEGIVHGGSIGLNRGLHPLSLTATETGIKDWCRRRAPGSSRRRRRLSGRSRASPGRGWTR